MNTGKPEKKSSDLPEASVAGTPGQDDPLAPTPIPEAPASSEASPPSAAAAQADVKIAELQAEIARTKDYMLRAMAETENTRKRAAKDREDAAKYANASFARDLLDFTDNFRRALESLPAELRGGGDERIANLIAGIEAMERNLLSTLDRHGIKKLDPMDKPFDPNFHEVLFEAPGTGKPAGTIVQVIEAGYMLHDRLLRPARVGVAKSDGAAPPGAAPGSHIDQKA